MCTNILFSLLFLLIGFSAQGAGVPVRLSFKFILNANGNRPPTGNMNTDEEIAGQVDRANRIFNGAFSELKIQNLEIVDVAGVQQWYLLDKTETDRDNLRNAAMADPNTYSWRNDAVNVYITGSNITGISDFPPNNNIILVGQGAALTTIAHEVGHILNLRHTQEGETDGCTNCGVTCMPGTGDGCQDILPDSHCFNQDGVSMNAFGLPYASLNPAQQAQVDMTWGNLMSYHDLNNRSRLSPCQMDRQSAQAYADRNRLLSKIPFYVDGSYGGSQSGSFTGPFQTVQQAINAGATEIVLEPGTSSHPANPLTSPAEIVARKGPSTIHDAPPAYDLPYALEFSTNAAVREAAVRAQQADRRKNLEEVIANLKQAEEHATGREKSALQLELAQRYRDSERFQEAADYFRKTAAGADQPELQKHALENAGAMVKEAAKPRRPARKEEDKK